MKLTGYIRPIDFRAVIANLCRMIRLLGVFLTVPLLISLVAGEWIFSIIFTGMAAVSFAVGYFGAFGQQKDLAVKEALVVTALSYLLFALTGSLAFLPQASFIDGFFEAMSGFTTTGLTVMNPESLPKSLIFFRAYSQWLGGAGIMILSLVILVGPGKNAFRLYSTEFGEENLIGDVKATARLVFKIYLVLTAAGYLAFVAAGMGFFDALLHTLTTLSTGGFSPYADSIAHYPNETIYLATAVFMILGAIGFPAYYLLLRRGLRRFWGDLQLKYLTGIILIGTLLFWMAWGWNTSQLSESFFHAVTAITTTGFSVESTARWPEEVKLGSLLLMFIGGSAGSTAGGIKLFRFILIIYSLRWLLLHITLPEEAKVPIKYGKLVISDREMKRVSILLFCYLGLILLTSLPFVFAGFDTLAALFECTSALGTVGLSSGITTGQLSGGLKLLLIFDMWAGRLEILPVLLVFYPRIWKR